ncbi:hypothetical protein HZU75_09230 [Chitinibacter fontanus]|uniref:Uncharacterized protein n=1 Tax=Chitinibacter fontanus TaxID=1737446 RepID=A0A7D5V9K8_9NEIS|nr:hypothetical protein [Chitinibacter fontanus]QLI81697.1 hypothetical protein HZU75_09230 [Chitinibacter fontanus]
MQKTMQTGVLLLLLAISPPLLAARQAVLLKPVKPNLAAQLCPQISPPCDAADTQLFQTANQRQFLLDSSKPALIELLASKPSIRLGTYLDLSGYQHSWAFEGATMSIYPVLYPVGKDDWAIAVLMSASWPYSGGGGSIDLADFLPFSPRQQPISADNAWYQSVPFACSEMMRACFLVNGNDDYDKSPHCHDEYSGSLRIKYPDNPLPNRADWTFIWSEYRWPAHVPKTQAERHQKKLKLPAQVCSVP